MSAMEEKNPKGTSSAHHVEDNNNQVNIQALQDAGQIKTAKVVSVALADALAKDNPSTTSWSMIKLYGIIVLVTMSEQPEPPFSRSPDHFC
jgi:hypothetical protein